MSEELVIDDSFSRKVKDIAAGFIGGATQVLIGQPADLVKVRLQTSGESSSLQIIKQVLQNEGVFAFYKGTLPPLFGVGVCVSLQFYGFHEAKRQMLATGGGIDGQLNIWPQTYIAGAIAGIANTPVSSPVEQLRILSQANKSHISLTSTVKKIYHENGIARGIFRGTNITLLREIQAYGVWFLSYESTIRYLIKSQGYKSRDDVTTPELLFSGALAGNFLWLASYPLDVIKSNVQSDKFGSESKFSGSSIRAMKHIFNVHGLAGFWRGIVPCLLRATPCSAGTFAAVEWSLRLMG